MLTAVSFKWNDALYVVYCMKWTESDYAKLQPGFLHSLPEVASSMIQTYCFWIQDTFIAVSFSASIVVRVLSCKIENPLSMNSIVARKFDGLSHLLCTDSNRSPEKCCS